MVRCTWLRQLTTPGGEGAPVLDDRNEVSGIGLIRTWIRCRSHVTFTRISKSSGTWMTFDAPKIRPRHRTAFKVDVVDSLLVALVIVDASEPSSRPLFQPMESGLTLVPSGIASRTRADSTRLNLLRLWLPIRAVAACAVSVLGSRLHPAHARSRSAALERNA